MSLVFLAHFYQQHVTELGFQDIQFSLAIMKERIDRIDNVKK